MEVAQCRFVDYTHPVQGGQIVPQGFDDLTHLQKVPHPSTIWKPAPRGAGVWFLSLSSALVYEDEIGHSSLMHCPRLGVRIGDARFQDYLHIASWRNGGIFPRHANRPLVFHRKS